MRCPVAVMFVGLAALGTDAAWGGAAESPPAGREVRRPNIVLVLADQWRARSTGYAGDPNLRTPNLDRLARQGVYFRNAVSVCPVCTPYRAALMTGRFPTSTGMFLNDAYLPPSEPCIAEAFRAAGYATGYIGKWHLDGHGRDSYVPPERRRGWEYWKAAECDHNYNHSHYYTGTSPEKHYWDGYDAFPQTRDAQEYLHRHAASGPFFLMVAYGTPHFPHQSAPQKYKDLYPPEKLQLATNVPASQEKRVRSELQGYYAHCTALDDCVGDLMKTLDELKLADNTILIFTSDHGEMMGAHGCPPTMKQVPWDESAHVPLLIRWPAAQGNRGRTVETPLTTPDLTATLCHLGGVAIPKTAEGEDLSDLVRNGRGSVKHAALYMGVAPFNGGPMAREYRAVRTERYTYVRGLAGPWLLFDDQKDPYQLDNLVGKPEYRAIEKELESTLQSELARIGDDFRPAREYVKAWGYEPAPHGSVSYAPGAKVQSPRRK